MKAVRIHRFGDETVLQLDDIPIPLPGKGQLLVKVEAASLNGGDLYIRRFGNTHIGADDLPVTLGRDAVGTVEALGSGVTGYREGDRVAVVPGLGGYAEYVVAPTHEAGHIPEGMDPITAAAAPWVFLTAWFALTRGGQLKKGEVALIQAGGSGVGTAAIQIAGYLGAKAITTAGTDERCARTLELGAIAAINYNQKELVPEVLRLTDSWGVDVVLETIGGDMYYKALETLAVGGRLVSLGRSGGEFPDPAPEPPRGRTAARFSISACLEEDLKAIEQMEVLLDLVHKGTFKAVVDRTFPLAEAAEAQRYLGSRKAFGKVVLTV